MVRRWWPGELLGRKNCCGKDDECEKEKAFGHGVEILGRNSVPQ